MTDFGRDNPREMPHHLFSTAIRIDYSTAVRANPDQQNCSICPRHWYIDAAFSCARCDREFSFSAAEQRTWYEEFGFWIDSLPKHCQTCRAALRELKAARQEYDRCIEAALQSNDGELSARVVDLIDQLCELGGELPPRINENRRRLAKLAQRSER